MQAKQSGGMLSHTDELKTFPNQPQLASGEVSFLKSGLLHPNQFGLKRDGQFDSKTELALFSLSLSRSLVLSVVIRRKVKLMSPTLFAVCVCAGFVSFVTLFCSCFVPFVVNL